MKRALITIILVLNVLAVATNTIHPAAATTWGSPTAIPGADPYENTFPRLLQVANGSLWLVWQKLVTTYGEIYQMVNNGFGWSGQIPLLNSNGAYDDITPSIAQLNNGTIVLVWTRGSPGSGGCFGTNTYDIYTESYTNGKWSSPSRLVQTSGDDMTPALAKLSDGRLFLAWSKCTSTNGFGDLYYKIYNNTWGADTLLAGSSTAEEKLPGVTQTYDGRIWVTYSSNTSGINLVYYTVWNGTSWTSSTQLTNTANDDDWPSIVQDRNGTLWVFWARFLPNGTLNGQASYQYDLFYENSTNYGSTWSTDQPAAPNINSDEKQPFIIQNSDKKIYLAYSSNQRLGNPYQTPNLYLITTGIIKAHDLAVTSLTPPSPPERTGEIVNLVSTVSNLGDYTESSQVNYYANSTLAGSQPITLNAGQTTTLTLPWNSAGKIPGRYVAKATVNTVTGELVTLNNSFNSTLYLLNRGDVNRDGIVDIVDLAQVAIHMGAVRGASNWYGSADLNGDGIIDIADLSICGGDFGRSVSVPDLAITSVKPPAANPRMREPVTLLVTVTNKGGIAQSSQVSVYANQTLAGTLPVSLSGGQSTTLTFVWNSTGHKAGRYVAQATVTPVNGELITSNNSLNSTFLLTFRGDENRDGIVDIVDLTNVASRAGATIGSPKYLSDADLNKDGVIDIVDLTTCAADFGKSIT